MKLPDETAEIVVGILGIENEGPARVYFKEHFAGRQAQEKDMRADRCVVSARVAGESARLVHLAGGLTILTLDTPQIRTSTEVYEEGGSIKRSWMKGPDGRVKILKPTHTVWGDEVIADELHEKADAVLRAVRAVRKARPRPPRAGLG